LASEITLKKTRRIAIAIGSRGVFYYAFFAVLTYEWICRARLLRTLYVAANQGAPILTFVPGSSSKLSLAAGLIQDVICACLCALLIWAAVFVTQKLPLVGKSRCAAPLKHLVVTSILLCISFAFCLHYSLIVFFHSGLTRQLLQYAADDFKLTSYLKYVTPYDLVFILLIVPLYYLNARAPDRLLFPMRSILLAGAILTIPIFLLDKFEARARKHLWAAMQHGTAAGQTMAWEVLPELSANPVLRFLHQIAISGPSPYDKPTALPTLEQRKTAALIDPAFSLSSQIGQSSIGESQTHWNIVFLLLESINAKQLTLMPFTEHLTNQSLVFENHFSAGVDTNYATFPIFTGVYPMPENIDFADRANLRFPTLFSETQPTRSNTFVTDGDTRFWYPIHLLMNSGLREVWDEQNLPTQDYRVWFAAFKDPVETTDFFISRIRSLPEPFVAVYNLQATHSPYFDYQRRSIVAASGGPHERYDRDVTLVDSQIESIFKALKSSGVAERTIFVITSDHGEAFGEHPDDYGHGLYLYNETVNVPMLLYQPRVIPPGKVSDVTSHVDILPTLLDAMSVPYDPLEFEGESAFRKLRRKYVFIYGPKADMIASVSRDRVKIIVDGASDRCAAYNLEGDPNEAHPQPCEGYSEQLNALLEYRQHQRRFLVNYDAACQKKWPCAQIEPYGSDRKSM
jgi:hypothetical protein